MNTSHPQRGSHALRGSLLLAALVSPAVLGLLVLGITREQPPLLEAAFRLAVLVLASGAGAGAVYDATRGMRNGGAFVRAACWWLVAGSAAALLLVATRVFLTPLLAPGSSDALYAMSLTGWTGVKVLGAAVLVFGWAMASVTEPAPPGILRERSWFVDRMLPIVEIVFIVWAISNFAGTPPPARVLPENAVEARRVIATAERDAHEHPDDGEAQFAYGLSLMNLSRYSEARPVLARSEQLLPDDPWPSNALGWVLLQQHDYAAALPHFQRAVRIDHGYGAAYHNLGWTLCNLGRRDEAEAAYGQAALLEPRESGMLADYASLLFQNRKTDRAIAQIYRAIKLDSANARYHAAAGYFLRSKARFADARAEFKRAAELAPSIAATWVQLGITDFLMGDARGADSAFTAAAKRDSTFLRSAELRTMWESARKGKAITPQATPLNGYRLDSAAAARH